MPLASLIPTPSAAEFAARDAWLHRHLLHDDARLPFSFTCGGTDGAALLAEWPRHAQCTVLDDHRTQYTLIWSAPDGGLQVRCAAVVYDDFPTVEWTVYWTNTGTASTALLADLQGLDIALTRTQDAEFVLHYADGDLTAPASYQPHAQTLAPGSRHTFAPPGGRPTFGAYPFYKLAFDDGGVIAVIGWPGQWAATFTRDAATALRVVGGQELTSLTLLPGEEVRAPLIVLQFWEGDPTRAQNLWRRWMLAHNTPPMAGAPARPVLSSLMIVGPDQTATNQIDFIDAWRRHGIDLDYWWLDAGWYPCGEHWSQVGTWEPDAARFPHGIEAVAAKAHAEAMGLIMWFEPERVSRGSWLDTTHPEWCLQVDDGNRLLNLGHPEARAWVTDLIDDYLTHRGLDLYRQDFNIDPLAFWRAADAPDRRGMTENQYVQGYLAFWDALHARHPGLIIDTCSSGGRRNDLETLRRSVILLRSDYQTPQGRFFSPNDPTPLHVGNQGQTYGLTAWVPYMGGIAYIEDDYDRRSHLTPALGLMPREMCEATMQHYCGQTRIYELLGEIDWAAFRRAVAEWRQVADAFLGDYYPLTPYSLDADRWMAWQFHCPETGTGIVQVFRHTEAVEDTWCGPLQGLDPDAMYVLTDLDGGAPEHRSGRALHTDGFTVRCAHRPQAVLISYRAHPASLITT
jgi:alpha-galactosidase